MLQNAMGAECCYVTSLQEMLAACRMCGSTTSGELLSSGRCLKALDATSAKKLARRLRVRALAK